MTCASCGSENLSSARFCAACGFRFGGFGALAPRPRLAPAQVLVAAPAPAMMRPMFYACPHCGQAMQPVPYFSRGMNVAKAVVLMFPFSFVGPILLFLLRKDRLICGACSRLLGAELMTPVLPAYGVAGAGGALSVYDPEGDVGALERQSRFRRARAWSWGALSASLAGIGAFSITQSVAAGRVFLLMAVPAAGLALFSAIRSVTTRNLARFKRARAQRGRILELARISGGRLNVSLVAADLRIELDEADQLLGGMVDGQRVEMEVDDAGRISYLFTELV